MEHCIVFHYLVEGYHVPNIRMMDDGYDEAAFSCRLDTTRDLVTLLSCLSHGTKKDQHAFCEVSTRGMHYFFLCGIGCIWIMRSFVVCRV